jgi:hypothetical protein
VIDPTGRYSWHAVPTRSRHHDEPDTKGGDVVDQLTREHTVSGEARHGRTWITVLIVVVVLAAAALGTWAVIGNSNAPAAVAADLADQFLAGANASDGEAVAALFTEDGILDMQDWRMTHGHDAIAADVNYWSPYTDNWERVGDVVETEDGTFTFAARGDYSGNYLGRPWEGAFAGEGEIELDGDLIARLHWDGHPPEE